VLLSSKFSGKKVFQKNQDGGSNYFFQSSRHLEFFEKLFFPQNLRLSNTKWMQKEN
jgi:hypothetical protein